MGAEHEEKKLRFRTRSKARQIMALQALVPEEHRSPQMAKVFERMVRLADEILVENTEPGDTVLR